MYRNAIAWRSSTWQTASVIGPALGGLLYGFAGAGLAYAVAAALMVVALGAFLTVRYTPEPRASRATSMFESCSRGCAS